MDGKAMKLGGYLTTDWVANRYRIFRESGHTYIWEQDFDMQPGDLLSFWNWVHTVQNKATKTT